MILIITALMIEATPLIEYFKLKRDMSIHEFPVYRNAEIALIVSGIGKVKSAVAATYLLSICNAKYCKDDLIESKNNDNKNHTLINIGFCGVSDTRYEIGSLILINKVTDMDTGIDSYPDIFIGKDLPKDAIYCFSKPVSKEYLESFECHKTKNIFCDMESSGIMEVAKKFTYAHQVVILKVISDYLNPNNYNKETLKGYLTKQIPKIEQIIDEVKQLNYYFNQNFTDEFSMKEEKRILEIVSENLKFSYAMKQILLKEVKKAICKGMDPLKVLESYTQVKVNSKIEGKKIFNEIKAKLNA